MRYYVVDGEFLQSNLEIALHVIRDAYIHSSKAKTSYPLFDEWFIQKVIVGLILGERIILAGYQGDLFCGCSILKKSKSELKICHLSVASHAKGSILPVRLFERSFHILGTEMPLLSIPEAHIGAYCNITRHFNFEVERVYCDLYIPGKKELALNGFLEDTIPAYSPIIRRFSPKVAVNTSTQASPQLIKNLELLEDSRRIPTPQPIAPSVPSSLIGTLDTLIKHLFPQRNKILTA